MKADSDKPFRAWEKADLVIEEIAGTMVEELIEFDLRGALSLIEKETHQGWKIQIPFTSETPFYESVTGDKFRIRNSLINVGIKGLK